MSQSYLPFLGYGGKNSSSVLNPLQLFGNNLKGWLKTDSGNEFNPTISDGDVVPTVAPTFGWLDHSNFANMNMGGSGGGHNNPLYRNNQINGFGGLVFDGVISNFIVSYIDKSVWNFLHQSTNTIVLFVKVNSGGAFTIKRAFANGGEVGSGTGMQILFRNDSGFEGVAQHIIRNSGTIHINTKTPTLSIPFDSYHVFEFNYDGLSGNIYIDFIFSATSSAVGSPSSADYSDANVHFGQTGSDNTFQDNLSEVIILDKIMNTSERENLKTYFNDKYALTL